MKFIIYFSCSIGWSSQNNKKIMHIRHADKFQDVSIKIIEHYLVGGTCNVNAGNLKNVLPSVAGLRGEMRAQLFLKGVDPDISQLLFVDTNN